MDRKVLKYQNFYCYLLLAAENFLLAEQFQITASSSASKLPARANTSAMNKSIKTINWAKVREDLEHLEPVVRCSSKTEIDESIEEFGSAI